MSVIIPKEIRNTFDERLDFEVHPGTGDRVVLIGHGVTGSKDRPFLVELAKGLAGAGVTAVRFSFAGNGRSDGNFTESTILKEVEDLGRMIDAFTPAPIGYVGHSLGAAVGALRASTDPRITFLVSLAGMAHTAAFVEREFGAVTPDNGYMWEDPACPLSQLFVDDMKRVCVDEAARQITVPWLLVHGLADDVVPPRESRDLCEIAAGPTRLEMIEEADHVFSGAATDRMVRLVVDWVLRLDEKQP